MERIARREVKYVGYFESDPIRCASDPIRIFLREHSEFLNRRSRADLPSRRVDREKTSQPLWFYLPEDHFRWIL